MTVFAFELRHNKTALLIWSAIIPTHAIISAHKCFLHRVIFFIFSPI